MLANFANDDWIEFESLAFDDKTVVLRGVKWQDNAGGRGLERHPVPQWALRIRYKSTIERELIVVVRKIQALFDENMIVAEFCL